MKDVLDLQQLELLVLLLLYQYFLDLGYKDARVLFNYGIILKDKGRLEEAEIITRKAIEMDPE